MHLVVAAVTQMEEDLSATSAEFILSIAVFILILGVVPLARTSISEVKGGKVYRSLDVLPQVTSRAVSRKFRSLSYRCLWSERSWPLRAKASNCKLLHLSLDVLLGIKCCVCLIGSRALQAAG